jgi:hypothetical protein
MWSRRDFLVTSGASLGLAACARTNPTQPAAVEILDPATPMHQSCAASRCKMGACQGVATSSSTERPIWRLVIRDFPTVWLSH